MNNPTSPSSALPTSSGSLLEDLLKNPATLLSKWNEGRGISSLAVALLLALGAFAVYGLAIGSFSGGVQWVAAPAKVAVGALISVLICLPSFYIFLCLSGGDPKISTVMGASVAMLCTQGLLLVGFLPVAWIFSQSTTSAVFMGFLLVIIWIVSLCIGFRILGITAQMLGLTRKGNLIIWALIFSLVTLQMSTALRPLVGRSDTLLPTEKKFFLVHWVDCMVQASREPVTGK